MNVPRGSRSSWNFCGFFCDGEHPDDHQVGDSADRLDSVRMEAVARLAAFCVWATANGKTRPQELGKQPGW